jgi:hypothetical protein
MADDIALQIEMQAALPENRGVVFRTFITRDCSQADLDAVMDKLRTAVERQTAFAEVEKWEDNLLNEERIAKTHARNIDIVQDNHQRRWQESHRRGPLQLSASEQKERQGAHANLEQSRDNIAMAKKKIELYRARTNGHAG